MEEVKNAFDLNSIIAPSFTILGGILGAIGTYFINSKIESKKHKYDNLKIKLSKLEDIYYRYEKWEVSYINFFDTYLKGFQMGYLKKDMDNIREKLDEEKYLTTPKNDLSENIKKLNAIINIYTPELIDIYSQVELSKDTISNRIVNLSDESNDAVILEKLCSAFYENSNNFKRSLRSLSSELLKTIP